MFGTIRRHQTWLWAVIITVIIISFVLFFSPYSRVNNGERGKANFGSIDGHPITREKYADARREIYLRHFFMSGAWPDEDKRSNFDPERDTYQWLLIIQKQEDMGIHVSSDTAAEVGKEKIKMLQQMNIHSPDVFFNQVLKPRGLDAEDFERYLRHDLGLAQLIATVGLSGKLVTPEEAKGLYIREHEELDTEAVFFNGTNYVAQVNPTPEALTQFYSNRVTVGGYTIPEQVQVSYVQFNITNYLAQSEAEWAKTNLNEVVEMNYQRVGTNYFKDAHTPEETKPKIRDELIRTRALAEARKKAIQFAGPLFEMNSPRAEMLDEFAKTNGLQVQVTQPFDRTYGPTNLEVSAEFTKQAFSRTPEEPLAGPIMGRDGIYIIALKQRLPSRVPGFEEVRDKVTADYKLSQAMSLARQAGMAFSQTASNALAQGKTFDAVCTEAKVPVTVIPRFSLSTRSLPQIEDQVRLEQLKQVAFGTSPGKLSDFQMTAEGGFILFVKAKLPVDEVKMKNELTSFTTFVRQKRQEEAFNDWFRKEAEKGLRDTPLNKPTTPAMNQARSAKS